MMHLRLRSVRRAVLVTSVLFFTSCVYLYLYAGYKDNDPFESDRQFQLFQQKSETREKELLIRNQFDPTEITAHRQSTASKMEMEKIFEELKFDNKPGGVWKQGFEITYNMSQWEREPLEVFLVPHSHQDPGWIFTIDEYFEKKTRAGLDATLDILLRHPEARFIYAEMSFFSKWVSGLTPKSKSLVAQLLHNGQLEIVSGGWVMPDEATASYYAIVDQVIEGHHWLWDNFAYRPNISWSIDPFGQSTSVAYLIRKMGFMGMVIGRVHYEVKKYLAQRKALEFHWRQSWDPETQAQIPCHLLAFYAYDVPHTCGPDPAVCCQFDFLRLKVAPCPWKHNPSVIRAENVDERTALLVDQYRKKATLYNQPGVLLVPLGDDFRYLSTTEWELQLENYNRIIQHLNEHPEYRVKLRFATLSEYFEAFYRRHGHKPRAATQSSVSPMLLNLTLFTGDLFTYADRDHDYWSGFFTSRPVEKFLTRTLESELRSSELLYTYARHLIQRLPDSSLNETVHLLDDRITLARRALGLFQHHDGVTGTAKSHVVADYNRRLRSALNDCRLISAVSSAALLLALPSPAADLTKRAVNPQQVINTIREVHRLPKESQGVATIISMEDLYFREAAPVPYRIKIETTHESIPIVIFNPLLQPRITTVTVELIGVYEHFNVKFAPHVSESMENPITMQIESPDSDAGQQTRLRIGPVHLAPLSLSQLVIEHSETHSERSVIVSYEPPVRTQSSNLIWLNSDSIGLGFDAHTGLLRYLIDSRLNVVLNVTIDFLIYQTNDKAESRSGAYLFIPNSPGRVMELPNKPKVRITRGPLVQEIILYTPLVQHSVRLYKYPSNVIEIENTVSLGKFHPQNVELVMRIQSNVSNSDRTFFTDSNCFQFVRRHYYDKIPFQGNLYPMSCGVYIQSDSLADRPWVTRLHLFSTYSHGVTSPIPGALYVWLDRRTTDNDNRGLFEPLNGAWIARSNFRLFVETVLPAQKKATPLLSTEAHAVVNDLIRPIQRFLVGHNISSFMARTVHLMPNFTMPKDYDLVSLKTFHHNTELFKTFSDYYGAQIGMLLRRLPVGFGEQIPHEISVAQMFSRLNRTRAVRTPLTLIPEMSSVRSLQGRLPTVTVKPMELEAYLLTV